MNQSKIKILVVDDSRFTQQRLTQFLNQFNDFDVVGTASNASETLSKNQQLQPDLITLDHELTGINGLDIIVDLKRFSLA